MGVTQMRDIHACRPEDVDERVKEMDSNIGGDTAGLLLVAFPRRMVPMAA
jgi:hypothetical protein